MPGCYRTLREARRMLRRRSRPPCGDFSEIGENTRYKGACPLVACRPKREDRAAPRRFRRDWEHEGVCPLVACRLALHQEGETRWAKVIFAPGVASSTTARTGSRARGRTTSRSSPSNEGFRVSCALVGHALAGPSRGLGAARRAGDHGPLAGSLGPVRWTDVGVPSCASITDARA